MPLSDQQIAEIRYTTVARKIDAEQQLELVVLAGMDLWLNRVACLIVGQPGPALVADGEPVEPWVNRLDQAAAAANEWLLFLDVGLVPQVGALFGEAFNQARRGDEFNPYRWQQDYMQEVYDRLKLWPAGAFEDLRPDLVEALSDAATIDQVMNQIGDTLGISAESRRHRANISALDHALKDETLSPAERSRLVGQRAQLWRAHDASLDDWEWKARRIARTEVQGAMEAGNVSAAKAWTAATGEQQYKQWLATEDGRTRHSHALASGQIVRLEEKFTVGDAHLDHPGEAGGPAHEVIQCRCTTLILDADDVQDELQGKRGSIGEIKPGGSRLGPDDPDLVAQKIARLEEDGGQRALVAAGLHYVRTPRGVRRYKRPIGSLIGGNRTTPHLDDPKLPGTWSHPDTAKHILDGDRTGGGHRSGTGRPNKSEFPKDWSDAKVMDAVAQTVLNPGLRSDFRDKISRESIVDGVHVHAVARVVNGNEVFQKAYPVSGTGVMKNDESGHPKPTRPLTPKQVARFTPKQHGGTLNP